MGHDDVLEVACSCGAVRLTLAGKPIAQFFCHCDDCQKVHGAPMVGIAAWPADATRVHGEVSRWALKRTPRITCVACGTRMFAAPQAAPIHGVSATLLPSGMFAPAWHHQCQFAQRPVVDALPHYAGWPPALGGSDTTVDW